MSKDIQREVITTFKGINSRYIEAIIKNRGIGAKGKEYCVETAKRELIRRASNTPNKADNELRERELAQATLRKLVKTLRKEGKCFLSEATLLSAANDIQKIIHNFKTN